MQRRFPSPPPPPVNQLQRDVGRASVEGRERAGRCGEAVLFNADSQTHTPLLLLQSQHKPGLPHHYSRFMISNRLGRGLLFCLTFPPLANSALFHFSTSFVEKSILENKHSVSSLRVQVNLDFVHVFPPLSLSFFFFFSPRGLIVFTCHICFIPSNVIFPRYWEHLFAPRPGMEVLEREFIFLNPLLISSLRCGGGAARGASHRDGGCS